MRIRALIVVGFWLTACTQLPDTVGEAAPTGTVWSLVEVNDAPATYGASLRLLSSGRVLGTGPCNSFTATQTAPLPWVEFTDITPTERSCAQLRQEEGFFLALESMDFSEIAGESLLLSNDTGQSLFFRAAEGPST
ncbi:MAG: META domain-containing protein [Pseudomonadota bacterium]